MPAYFYAWTNNIRPRLTSYIKPHIITTLSIPTTWRRNAMTIDMVEIMMMHCRRHSITSWLPLRTVGDIELCSYFVLNLI